MKNFYANGYNLSGIRDGHDWGPLTKKPDWWDGAECKDCGAVASNAEIAGGRVPSCTVPVGLSGG